MKIRIITGLIAAAATIASVLYLPYPLIVVLTSTLAVGAYLEFDRMMLGNSDNRYRRIGMPAAIVCLMLVASGLPYGWGLPDPGVDATFFSLAALILAVTVWRARNETDFTDAVRNCAVKLLGLVYVFLIFGFLLYLAKMPDKGRVYILWLFFVVFIGDTFAYFGGMLLGRRKLASNISPKKTLEGAFSALVGSLLVSIIFGVWAKNEFNLELSEILPRVILFAPVASALAQIGDLFESLLKRSQHQKDSGTLLPGHGGLLDRLDGLALVSPIFYLFIIFFLEPIL